MASEEDLTRSVEAEEEPRSPEPVSPRTIFRWTVAAGIAVVAIYLGYHIVYAVRDVLVEILIAAFIAISLDPPVRLLVRRGVKRSYAVLIILVIVFIVVAGLLMLFIPPLVQQSGRLTSNFPQYLNHLRSSTPGLRKLESRFHLQNAIDDLARNLPARLGAQALGFTRKFFGALISGLLVLVLTIYFMADLPRLRRNVVRLFSRRYRRPVDDAVDVVIDKVGSYMIGNLIISGIAGVSSLAMMEILRIPFALPLAVFVAVTDLIPLVGAAIGAVVGVIVALATTDLWPHAVLLGLFFLAYQQLENYLIAPRVLRNTVAIPALAVLLAALLGGTILGLIGALIAIPLAAAVKVIMTPVLRARDAEQAGPGERAGSTLDADAPE
ncbi:AI-2E family transporter [Rugosimonospora acidiphila]|uniref:AI-2E family transporter n=1 Tax=Rugosimonospora acidiphila TaxID=556531 RepID=A0ABP9RRW6_9ACTN